jgi:hypothetical protein
MLSYSPRLHISFNQVKAMKIIKPCAALLVLATAWPAMAGPSSDALSACFADHTTGKERKQLARWIFVAMAAHPDIGDLAVVAATDREASNKAVGELVTRLISQNCVEPARAAIKNDGGDALKNAFGVLGRLAMQELMTNPAVTSSLAGYERFIDKKQVEAAFSTQPSVAPSDRP